VDRTTSLDTAGSWRTAAAATAVLGVVLGVFGSVGVLVGPLAAVYDVPRSQVGLLFPAALAVHSLVARTAGRVLDRSGPRPLLGLAAVGMAAGPSVAAAAPTVWPAVAGYGLGVGVASGCAWVAATGVVSAAFQRRRAAALGLLAAGPAAGGVVFAPVMAALADAHGPWWTCLAVAALGGATCAAGAVLLGGRRVACPGPVAAESGEPAPRRFLGAGLLASLVVFVPVAHMAGNAETLGLSPEQGATLLAVVSAVSAATRLGAGWWATPAALPSLYRGAHVLIAAAFGLWALAESFALLLVVAALFGAGYGAWLSLGPAVLAASCAPGQLGRALGSLATVVGIGGVIGPVLAGHLLETAATALLTTCAISALAAGLILTDLRRRELT
jgi:MFS family permease